MTFIKLTNAGGRLINDVRVRADLIERIETPDNQSSGIGTILVVKGQQVPVKEYAIDIIDALKKAGYEEINTKG